MAAGGIPTVQVLLDDGTGTFPFDITTKTRVAYSISRGRADEAAAVNPGGLTLTLENDDGRFTLGSTIIATPSPIKVDTRIRVKVTANATVFTRYTGYTQTWPVAWPSGSDLESTVTITATDAQARGERTSLRSVIQQETETRLAFAHYTLGEPSTATVAADSSGNQYPELVNLTGTPVVFGAGTGPPTDALQSPTFSNTAALVGAWPTPSGTGWSCVVFFNSAGPVSGIDAMKFVTLTNGPGAFTKINLTGTGGLLIQAPATGVGTFGSGRNDSKWHAVGISVNGAGAYTVMVDGATAGTGTVASLAGVPTGVQLGDAIGAGAGTGLGDQVGFIGGLAHLMLFNTTLTAADMIALGQAGTTGFAGESGTARITRLAGYANLPLGTLDTSLTNVAFVDTTGKSASAAIRDVADAEVGLVFYDGSGNLTFHNRNRPAAKTAPDVTITADALDPGTAFIVDMQGVLNYFEVTALGTKVTQVVRNTTSETSHGRYPGTASYLVQTDAEALDRGNWIVANHAEPLPRVGSLMIDMLTQDTATQAALLAAEPNTWIRVTGLPAQTPGGTTADLVVQGFADVLARDSWAITFNVVNRSLFTAWILGDATYSVLGSTTKLYV